MEPAVARRWPIPPKVGASLVIAVAWGYVAAVLAEPLARLASPAAAVPFMRILWLAGYIVGLILAKAGRAEVEDSDQTGQILAWFGIGLNAIRLALYVIPYAIGFAVSLGSRLG
jgi:hypothetical protein